jgi:hypothetical protein
LFLNNRSTATIIGKKNDAAMVVDSARKIMLGVRKTAQRDKTARAPVKTNVLNFKLGSLSALLSSQHIRIFTGFHQYE